MREFLKDKIFDLYLYCGNRQENKMTNEEIEKLLDVLERVCTVYNYIPEEKQKEIIEAQLLRDKEYQNINARLISKWLEENGKHFFTQQHHQQQQGRLTEADYTPLEGEARDQAIQNYLNELAKVQLSFTGGEDKKGRGAQMRENLDSAGVKFDESKHKKYDPEDVTGLQEMLEESETLKENNSEQQLNP